MSDTTQIILAIVVALPSTLSAVAAIIAARDTRRNLHVSRTNNAIVSEIKNNTNGVLDKAVATAHAAGKAEGMLAARGINPPT